MEEERWQLYYQLINELLACPDGEEINLLEANRNLIDLGLFLAMERVAVDFTENDNPNTAEWLQNIAQSLVEAIGFDSLDGMYEDYFNCLMSILQAVEANHEPESVYPLLENNLEKLDFNLGIVLQNWALETLENANPEDAVSIAVDIFNFGQLIQGFRQGNVIYSNIAIIASRIVLTVFTREIHPYEWANLQNYLGIIYRYKYGKENIDRAIKYYQNALLVWKQETYPNEWATTQNNLGFAYNTKGGEKNLNLAIECYQNALSERKREIFPDKWATTQENLGSAYSDKGGEENFNLAIEFYQNALSERKREIFPDKWARTQTNLGNAYSQKGGEENLDKAIEFYQNALLESKRETYPYEWATLQINLGRVYFYKGGAENLDKAIEFYQNALLESKRETYPYEWARTQTNLGDAYSQKGGEENLDKAIEFYQNALLVWKRETYPNEWASMQKNLGNAYQGKNGAENLAKTIESYQNALLEWQRETHPYKWAMTQAILGDAYQDKGGAENLDKAIEFYQNALLVWKRETYPNEWVTFQINLGNAYQDKNGAENLAKAIESYQNALLEWQREDHPYKWAAIQVILGDAYRNQGGTENLEKAIACYQLALLERKRETYPYEWAMTQLNLGIAYYNKGGAENLEKAIECYQNALLEWQEEDHPNEWARVQADLGDAYMDKRGAENLEKAIAYYQNALLIWQREVQLYDWARTQNHLGGAYYNKGGVENLDKAIACYQLALSEWQQTTYPYYWATMQNNLGLAYQNKGGVENLDKAIACYQLALREWQRTSYPSDWALVQNNLGNAYRNQGGAENLEKAIECYENALLERKRQTSPKDWAMVQTNLGNAYRDKGGAENLDKAIECYQNALTESKRETSSYDWAITQHNLGNAYQSKGGVENLDKAIECYQNALSIYTSQQFPIDCLKAARNLGHLAFTAGNWELAIIAYDKAIEALEISRSRTVSDDYRKDIIAEFIDVYQNMVQACINQGELEKAIEYRDRSCAKQLVDFMVSNDLYRGVETSPEVQEYRERYQYLTERLQQIDAARLSDNNKEVAMSGTKLRTAAILQAENAEIEEIEEERQQIWLKLRSLDPVIAGQIQVDSLSFSQMRQLIDNDTTVILSFYTTDDATYVFILYRNKEIQLHTCQREGINTLHNEFIGNNWLNPYLQNRDAWRQQENIETFLLELSERLQIDQLIDNYLQGIEELIIVPHLWLHQIPFAALPIGLQPFTNQCDMAIGRTPCAHTDTDFQTPIFGNDRGIVINKIPPKSPSSEQNNPINPIKYECFGERFTLRILPSCQILNYCYQRPHFDEQTLMGIVENASADLPYTAYECHTLATKYKIHSSKRLQRHQATATQCQQLAKKVQILHLSHHASANPSSPFDSQLIMHDRSISLREILTWRIISLLEVYLNNCETHYSITDISDNILTLATGFLCAGARSVISTLWSVDDCSSALLAIFYYDLRDAGFSRSQALQQAQKQLRNLTGQQLRDKYAQQLDRHLQQQFNEALAIEEEAKRNYNLAPKDAPEAQKWAEEIQKAKDFAEKIAYQRQQVLPNLCEQSYPFVNPFYWAGFISQGLA